MTPEEKPSSAERAARKHVEEFYQATERDWPVQGEARLQGFLAGAQWKAAQVAEVVAKIERVRNMLDASFSFDQYVRELDVAIALLKGTK